MDRWESIFNREHQVLAKVNVCKIISGPFKPDGLFSRKWRSVNHLSIAHKTLRIYNIIFGIKKGQTWVARQVENFPKRGGGVATLSTLTPDMVFVLSVLNRMYNSAEVCSKSVYMYFVLNGVFRGSYYKRAMYFTNYRIYSIRRPGRLLNFWALKLGAFSRLGAY